MSVHEKNVSLAVAAIKSTVIEDMPRLCADETAAIEFFEARRWPNGAGCLRCGSVDVYQMKDSKTGARQVNFRWRCRDCKYQFTVRTGTIFEDSPVPLRKWAQAFWMNASGKKGVAALELQRVLQISYKSALFMAHRIRFAMEDTSGERLTGTVEVDETYVGGKPRRLSAKQRAHLIAEGKEVPRAKRGRGTKKTPVVSVVQRDGKIRRRVIANITAENVGEFLNGTVHPSAMVCTDQLNIYPKATRRFRGHESVNHATDEYARTSADGLRVHTNTAESSHALLKRGIVGVWHRMSPQHFHRYLANADFLWNTRRMSDGDRLLALVGAIEGRRLFYRTPGLG